MRCLRCSSLDSSVSSRKVDLLSDTKRPSVCWLLCNYCVPSVCPIPWKRGARPALDGAKPVVRPESTFYKVRADYGNSIMFFGNIYAGWNVGFGFVTHRKLPEPGDPHLPAIERKVQSADEHPCNRQDCCGHVRIDQLVQIMEQEPTLIWVNSSLGFKPVL